jgi:TonB family protein
MISLLLLVKVTIVLAFGAAAYLCSGRFTPGTRNAFCAITLGTSALAPFIALYAPVRVAGVFLIAADSMKSTAQANLALWHGLNFLFMTGLCVVLARFLIGVIYLAWQTRRGVASDDTARGAQIRFAPVSTPILWGWLRPVVLLPLEARDWSNERRCFAIAHERAHLERRDNWSALLALAAQALYWFHPLVWWLSARMAEQRELACDNRVLSSGASPSEYADFLLDISRRFRSPALFGCAMASHSHPLRGRIMNILYAPTNDGSSRWSRPAIVLFSGLLAAAGVMVPATADHTPPRDTQHQVYKIGGDVSAPRVIYKVEPQYTDEAKHAKISGTVLLSIVVDADGNPGDVQVVRGLDPGLDKNAIAALSQWRFAPAIKNNQPVAAQADVEVHYRLK